ncbi:rho GTPase-activating protein 6-like isoform X2 [Lineus longissimus]|uniref:rho GTPase-activating protein 6-like isoform X2 n=1 Tax=Lineus longissimus TaxID=88925 RepID=UPI002B4CA016
MGAEKNTRKAMHKAKSPSATRRILPKKWRTKTKLLKSVWTPEGDNTWAHVSGKKVVLGNTTLLNLSEVERLALQRLAIAKLQAMSLGCGILIPKDGSPTKRHKRTAFSLKRVRSNSGNLTGLLDNLAKTKEKESKESTHGLVFGIPLSRCLANDLDHRRRRSFSLQERKDSLDLSNKNRGARKSSSSSISSTDNLSPHLDRGPMCNCDSLPRRDKPMCHDQTSASTSLIDALSLHSTSSVSRREDAKSTIDRRKSLLPSVPQVPNVVNTCCKHLETYGLQTLGIFRIGSSKKRIKQLREEFDTGKEVKLNEEHNPHDVGALLKEFYRDLPEPLLTRELYSAFIATRKLKDKHQQITALQLLVGLLPVPNRDTLWSLLKFLHKVAEHSTDTTDEQGHVLSGNKMDAHNLATLFGPNILHKVKGGAGQEFQVESLDRAEERKEIIEIVRDMIMFNTKLYEVPSDLHDDVLKALVENNPDGLDFLLKRKCDDMQITIEIEPDTSSGVYDECDSPPLTASPAPKREGNKIRTLSDAISMIHHHKPLRSTCSDAVVQAQKSRPRDYLTVPSRNNYRRSMPDPSVLVTQNYSGSDNLPTRSASEKAPSNKSLVSSSSIVRTNSSPVVLRRQQQQQRKQANLTVETSNLDDDMTTCGYGSRSPLRGSSNSVCYPQSPTKSALASGSSGSLQRNMQRWSLATPPSSGSTTPQSPRVLSPDHKATSSTQRPLGFFPAGNVTDARAQSASLGRKSASPEWQQDEWQQWENSSSKRPVPEKSIEQETLV